MSDSLMDILKKKQTKDSEDSKSSDPLDVREGNKIKTETSLDIKDEEKSSFKPNKYGRNQDEATTNQVYDDSVSNFFKSKKEEMKPKSDEDNKEDPLQKSPGKLIEWKPNPGEYTAPIAGYFCNGDELIVIRAKKDESNDEAIERVMSKEEWKPFKDKVVTSAKKLKCTDMSEEKKKPVATTDDIAKQYNLKPETLAGKVKE
jgi:hypothetical protein